MKIKRTLISLFKRHFRRGRRPRVLKVFSATQRCNIVSNSYIVVTLQRCVALKIVVANWPVQHRLNVFILFPDAVSVVHL